MLLHWQEHTCPQQGRLPEASVALGRLWWEGWSHRLAGTKSWSMVPSPKPTPPCLGWGVLFSVVTHLVTVVRSPPLPITLCQAPAGTALRGEAGLFSSQPCLCSLLVGFRPAALCLPMAVSPPACPQLVLFLNLTFLCRSGKQLLKTTHVPGHRCPVLDPSMFQV